MDCSSKPELTRGEAVANTSKEVLQRWGKAVGKEMDYVHLTFDDYVKPCPQGPKFGLELALCMTYLDKYGSEGYAKPGIELLTKEDSSVEGWVYAEDAVYGRCMGFSSGVVGAVVIVINFGQIAKFN